MGVEREAVRARRERDVGREEGVDAAVEIGLTPADELPPVAENALELHAYAARGAAAGNVENVSRDGHGLSCSAALPRWSISNELA